MTETAGRLDLQGGALAWRRVAGDGPTLIWLGGFRSEMAGTKADSLAAWASERRRDFLRFDYFGHGQSDGAFEDGTITRWRADALAVIDRLTAGPVVLAGSSMGGWLACLAAMARPDRLAGLLLIAPAADFTSALVPSPLPDGHPVSRKLVEDGARWSILPGPVPIEARARILQGVEDPEVPWRHALELALALKGCDVVFSLVRDGDHRLSRPQDLARLTAAAAELTGG